MADFSKDDAYKNLERMVYFVSNADTKTSFVLTFVGVLVAAFFTSGLIDEGFQSLISLVGKLERLDFKTVLAIVTLVALAAFLYYIIFGTTSLIRAVTARVDSRHVPGNLVRRSNLFFDHIASMDFDEFSQSTQALSEAELINDINSQTYINAKIATMKYRDYNKGLSNVKFAMLAFVAFAILMFIVRVVAPVK